MSKAIRAGVLALAAGLAGCGTPGPPQPPSLMLPAPVTDLSAVRTGDQVTLTWAMPRRTTDKVLLKDLIPVHVCREEAGGACETAADMRLAPGKDGSFTETLRGGLATGAPRPLRYFVELKNERGRSAGASNPAEVLAGQSPAAVSGFTAELRRDGVVLRWNAGQSDEAVRLHRVWLNPPLKKHENLAAPPPEPVEQNLLVAKDEGRALDKAVSFGHQYQYQAQRIARVDLDGKTLELAGPLSAVVRVDVDDVFPPSVPTGLAAVATPAANGAPASIDLNWQPVSDANLAGYFVYRREGDQPWQRISGDKPLVPPAFHDADVQAGHTFDYAVSAVSQTGHESARSGNAEETVPNE
ncbi:MAG: fibronectin type III domain-containing protein [Acidobacteriota bacterium]